MARKTKTKIDVSITGSYCEPRNNLLGKYDSYKLEAYTGLVQVMGWRDSIFFSPSAMVECKNKKSTMEEFASKIVFQLYDLYHADHTAGYSGKFRKGKNPLSELVSPVYSIKPNDGDIPLRKTLKKSKMVVRYTVKPKELNCDKLSDFLNDNHEELWEKNGKLWHRPITIVQVDKSWNEVKRTVMPAR